MFKNSDQNLLPKRKGKTVISRPIEKECVVFGNLRAGDFFTSQGELFLKINLSDAVRISDESISGTDQFATGMPVQVEDVEIHILR